MASTLLAAILALALAAAAPASAQPGGGFGGSGGWSQGCRNIIPPPPRDLRVRPVGNGLEAIWDTPYGNPCVDAYQGKTLEQAARPAAGKRAATDLMRAALRPGQHHARPAAHKKYQSSVSIFFGTIMARHAPRTADRAVCQAGGMTPSRPACTASTRLLTGCLLAACCVIACLACRSERSPRVWRLPGGGAPREQPQHADHRTAPQHSV